MNDDKPDKVKFNIGSTILETIGGLVMKTSRQYLEGDVMGRFYTLKAIKRFIVSKLKDEEETTLNNMELRIFLLNKISSKKPQYSNIVGSQVDKYDKQIMQLLEKYDYGIPTKKDHTNMYEE